MKKENEENKIKQTFYPDKGIKLKVTTCLTAERYKREVLDYIKEERIDSSIRLEVPSFEARSWLITVDEAWTLFRFFYCYFLGEKIKIFFTASKFFHIMLQLRLAKHIADVSFERGLFCKLFANLKRQLFD